MQHKWKPGDLVDGRHGQQGPCRSESHAKGITGKTRRYPGTARLLGRRRSAQAGGTSSESGPNSAEEFEPTQCLKARSGRANADLSPGILRPKQLREPIGQHLGRDLDAELAPRRPALLGQHHGVFAFGVSAAFEACQGGRDVRGLFGGQRRAVSPPPARGSAGFAEPGCGERWRFRCPWPCLLRRAAPRHRRGASHGTLSAQQHFHEQP